MKPAEPSNSAANTSSKPSRTRGRSKRASVARNPSSGILARTGRAAFRCKRACRSRGKPERNHAGPVGPGSIDQRRPLLR